MGVYGGLIICHIRVCVCSYSAQITPQAFDSPNCSEATACNETMPLLLRRTLMTSSHGLWSQWENTTQPSSPLTHTNTHTTFKSARKPKHTRVVAMWAASSVTPSTDHPNKADRTSRELAVLAFKKQNKPAPRKRIPRRPHFMTSF